MLLTGCTGVEYTSQDVLSEQGKAKYDALLAERAKVEAQIKQLDEIAQAVADGCYKGDNACEVAKQGGNHATEAGVFINIAKRGMVANVQPPKLQRLQAEANAAPVAMVAKVVEVQQAREQSKPKVWDNMTPRQRWKHYQAGLGLPDWETLAARERYQYYALLVAKHYGIPQTMFWAQLMQESGYNSRVCSHVGACGIGQFMPATAKGMGITDRNDPWQSIEGAAKYMKLNYKRTGNWKLALAAYNAGIGAVRKYKGIPPYRETQNYVKAIMAAANKEA
jgi:soluble lytic murein transglycosylase-like protein